MHKLTIQQVFNVSQQMRSDCYRIANEVGGDCEDIYNKIIMDVNVKNHLMFSVSRQEQLVGFIKGQFANLDFIGGAMAQIDWLYVDYNFHSQGIGSKLLHLYNRYVQLHGVKGCYLFSSPDSQEKKFYEKHGFQNIGKYFGHNNLMLKTFVTKDCLDARR